MATWSHSQMVTKKKYLKLADISAYKIASVLSDFVWEVVMKWDWFSKSTLGVQWVNSTDSIAGNTAEGFGRFHKRDKEKFYYNARGSVYESAHWTEKAAKRNLLTTKEKDYVMGELIKLPKELNFLIRITEEELSR